MAEDNIIHSIMGKGIDSTPDSLLPKNPGNSIFMRLGITGSTLFNALPYPAILLDAEGNVLGSNTSFQNKFPQDGNDNIHSFINQVRSAAIPQRNEDFKVVYKGKVYWSRVIDIGISHNGEKLGYILMLRDMSQVERIFLELAHVKGLNKQLDRIINASFDGLYITDGKGVTLRLNKAFERITGVTAPECLGRNVRELVAEGYFSRSGTLLALEKRARVTLPLQAKTGKNALVTSTPIFDDQGNTVLVVTNVRDMTELVELEQRLEQVEGLRQKELDAIFDSSYDGLYITDGHGNTLRLNEAFERITGITAQECVGRNMRDLVAEGYFSRSGTLLALEKRCAVTVPLQARTGKNALVTSTPIFDSEGNIALVVTNVRDMTELLDLEEKLERVEGLRQKELAAIFESSYDGLYITDGQGNTIRLNQAFERITGVTAQECVGKNMRELVAEGYFSRSGTLLALEQKQSVTVPLQAKTGKNALVTSTPVFDDNDNIVMVVTNVRDLTELNQLKQKVDDLETLSKAYHVELQQLRMESSAKYVFHSPPMRDLMRTLIHVASVESTVLIQGESGSGKEVAADLLHYHSPRRDMPFIKINCAAIPPNLLESELFGYEPGAFSGADRRGKPGIFELSNNGTLFLDEISELPLDLQAKLLRVLQDQSVMRIGGTQPIQVDVRIITGSNVNLWEMVQKKLFRADLYYRCNVVPIYVPPLRERIDDIPVLTAHFLDIFNKKYKLNKRIAPEVQQAFIQYDWPGNVRELRNLIERLVVTTMHDLITLNDLSNWTKTIPNRTPDDKMPTLKEALEATERKLLVSAFQRCKTTYEVAELLGISQASVVRKAKKFNILRKNRK
jgi:PAS domain S-box-containing protein